MSKSARTNSPLTLGPAHNLRSGNTLRQDPHLVIMEASINSLTEKIRSLETPDRLETFADGMNAKAWLVQFQIIAHGKGWASKDQTKPGSNLDAPTSDDEDQPDNFPPITDDSPVTQDQVLPPQLSQGEVPRTNTQPQRVITGIERAVNQNQKCYYKVIVEGQKHRPWVWREEVPSHILDHFHKTKTMKGTAKKHKKTRSYFTKQ